MSEVFKSLAKVAAQLAREGISKDRKNEQQGFKFRGIDDVYNALALPLAEAGLVCVPEVLERDVVERVNAKGTLLIYVNVKVRYTIFCAADGSSVSGVGVGEAMDSGDKATNKAQSAAFKYFWFQVLCIPTEGDNDADAQTHKEIIPHGADTSWSNLEASPTYEHFKAAWAATPATIRQWVIKSKQAELAALRKKLEPALAPAAVVGPGDIVGRNAQE